MSIVYKNYTSQNQNNENPFGETHYRPIYSHTSLLRLQGTGMYVKPFKYRMMVQHRYSLGFPIGGCVRIETV